MIGDVTEEKLRRNLQALVRWLVLCNLTPFLRYVTIVLRTIVYRKRAARNASHTKVINDRGADQCSDCASGDSQRSTQALQP